MITSNFIDNAKVMSKGQITIPKDIRTILGVDSGDRVTFIVENGNVRIVNSAVYAMKMLQNEMKSENNQYSETEIDNMVKNIRSEK